VTGEDLPDLFARAVALDAAGRRSLLAELAAADAAMAQELERMLEAEGGSSILDRPVHDLAAELAPWRPKTASPDAVGDRIGGYRILRELGRGGMGRVFLAEEETADFRRTLALKVIDRPLASEDEIRRFRDEVRILASLEHPGIARFLAGGQSPEGVWFLALEYVEGENLISYAARRALDVRARIELLLAVVEPVQYAHQQGVVHRDLKPSHLLVGKDGRPRLLDFGISKLLAPEGGESLTLTRTGLRALTPAYASPEQFRGERATFASDVYSLGIVLYELLAGRRPFGDEGSTPAELERAVLETDPEPPSTAARRAHAESGRPGSPAPSASHGERFDRDLDAICLKALRKEPGERYRSAAALADDLRNFLAGRPVAARRGGARYRAGRFVRRERTRMLTGGAIVAALAAAALAIAASREAARLRPAPPPEPRPFPFSQVTAVPIEELEREFAAAPDSVDAGAGLAIALGYADRLDEAALVLARMRQIPGREQDPLCDYVDGFLSQHRDQPQRALVLFTRARDGALSTGRGELVGRTRAARGRMLAILGQHAEGEREMELGLADFEKAGDALPAAQVLNNLAIESLQRGDYVRGEKRLEHALARFREAGAAGGVVLRNLAEVSLRRGRPDAAERWARESIRIEKGERPQRRRQLWVLGEALAEQGRAAEAIAILDEAIGYLRDAADWPDLAYALVVRGRVEVAAARLDRVGALVHELEDAARSSGDRVTLTAAKLLRGWAAAARGDADAARRELAEARRLQLEENEPVLAALTNVDRALVELAADDRGAALRILDDPSTDAGIGSSAGVLAEVLRCRIDAESGRLDAARQRLATLGDADAAAPDLRRRLTFLRARAALAAGEGRLDDARRDLAAAAEAARTGNRVVDEIELRLSVAEHDGERGREERVRWASEARRLGLVGLARRGERAPAQLATAANGRSL
jgi:serine/threonine-protein kinase